MIASKALRTLPSVNVCSPKVSSVPFAISSRENRHICPATSDTEMPSESRGSIETSYISLSGAGQFSMLRYTFHVNPFVSMHQMIPALLA